MKSNLSKLLLSKIKQIIQTIKNTENPDLRALSILTFIGIIVSIFWLFNATLVYDDIAFPASFSQLVDNIGWYKSLIKIFVLDLPNEYRTYGLSRVIQFILWSMGGSTVIVYTIIISLSQLATALALYMLLVSLKIERIIALSMGLMWLLSPFIWTSCFHHYAYLILPAQITIIGSYFLVTIVNLNKLAVLAILLGMTIALTGEMHLIAVPFILIAIALATNKRPVLHASFLTIISILLTVIAHYLTWKTFTANSIQHQRFVFNFSHDANLWTSKFLIAIRSISRSFQEQVSAIAGNDIIWLISATLLSALLAFTGLSWVTNRCNENIIKKENSRHATLKLAGALFIASFLYLTVFVMVVVLSDNIPLSMPRRYGYIPLTLVTSAFIIFLSTLCQKYLYKMIILSLMIGMMIMLFIRHQSIVIPTTIKADNKLSKIIKSAINKYPNKVVLFFNSAEEVFPQTSIDAYTLGPAMRDIINSEVTQAKYGTYWPAYMNISKVLGAPYTCEMGRIHKDGTIDLICPSWQKNPGFINSSDVIFIANLGYNKYDPLGEHVKVFKKYQDFEPYFFAKKIIRDINWTEASASEVVSVNLGMTSSINITDDVLPDKHFIDSMPQTSNSWLINYGITSGEDSVYKFPNVSINSEYYRSNRNGNFNYAFKFLESDIDVNLDFWELWGKKPGQRVFDIEVSWNNGAWVSLGKVDATQINGSKPFSIKLSRTNTHSFALKLSSMSNSEDVPFMQGIRISRRPPITANH